MPFTFSLARLPRIEFGAGRVNLLPPLIERYGKRVLLVTGGHSFLAGPHWPPLLEALKVRFIHCEIVQVNGEPSPDFVAMTSQ